MQSEFAQKRILCVDDNVVELTLRGKILESQGYSVVLLSCPMQALRCDLSAFDLAVLDFDMPGLNGRDLFLRMRALHARFPILLLSACASTLCPEDCVLFSRCLNKGEPVDPSLYYFRATPYFETASEKYGWLNRICCISTGSRTASGPTYHVFQVL